MKPFARRTLKSILVAMISALAVPSGHASAPDAVTAEIDTARPLGRLDPFWKATGFTPATALEDAVMRENLRRIAAAEPRAIDYLRPHYLLDIIAWENNRPQWQRFDAAMDFMVKELGYKLVFEVMGNPSQRIDFTKAEDIALWRDFITELIRHLQSRYGAETVRSWWFECWNEPDFEIFWTAGYDAFIAYYDATWEGIKAADPSLRFGGPANALGLNDLFKKFAAHVDATGHADFISVHRKFLPREMIAEERTLLSYLAQNHPRLAKLPFLNTEADAEFGWRKTWWWRAHPWYATFVVQSIDLHLREIIARDGVNYAMGLNDNAFTGNFGQRTLFASLPAPDGTTALVKKPVMAGMEMLARLGETRLASSLSPEHKDVGILATRGPSGEIAVLLYHRPDIGPPMEAGYPDIPKIAAAPVTVSLHVQGLGSAPLALAEWVLDDTHGNPFGVWHAQGRPERPTAEQLAALRTAEGPVALPAATITPAADGSLRRDITLPPASLRLLIFQATGDKPANRP